MSTAVGMWSAVRSYTGSSNQMVSTSRRWETHAPPEMNFSANSTCSGSSRTTSRTTRFVSTARMSLADVFSNRILHIRQILLECLRRKECQVNVLRRMPACSANNNLSTLLVPFENGTWAHSELLADLGGDRHLTLCRNFLFSDSHNSYITTVMDSQQ